MSVRETTVRQLAKLMGPRESFGDAIERAVEALQIRMEIEEKH